MNKCAAGVELLRHGSCPKCGATSKEPCPEAFRLMSEERDTLVEALKVAREAIWNGGDTVLAISKIDAALAAVGSARSGS